jgi:hypothetical protein
MGDITELMARNLKKAQAEYETAKNMLRILDALQANAPLSDDDFKTFRLSMYTPYKRRLEQAASKVTFWQDRDAVEAWQAGSRLTYEQKRGFDKPSDLIIEQL